MARQTEAPLHAGGRTLSKMFRRKGSDGGGKTRKRKRTWFQAGSDKGQNKGKVGSWPVGELPESLLNRKEK